MTFSLHSLLLWVGSRLGEKPQAPVSALFLPPVKVLTWIAFEFSAFSLTQRHRNCC